MWMARAAVFPFRDPYGSIKYGSDRPHLRGKGMVLGNRRPDRCIPHDRRGLNASWPGTWAQGVMFVITLPAEAVRHDLYPNQGGHKSWLVSI